MASDWLAEQDIKEGERIDWRELNEVLRKKGIIGICTYFKSLKFTNYNPIDSWEDLD